MTACDLACLSATQDPYYNEPTVDLMRGTKEGEVSSMRCGSCSVMHCRAFVPVQSWHCCAVLTSIAEARRSMWTCTLCWAVLALPHAPLWPSQLPLCCAMLCSGTMLRCVCPRCVGLCWPSCANHLQDWKKSSKHTSGGAWTLTCMAPVLTEH